MVHVVLKNGKVIRYNDGHTIYEEGQSYAIRTRNGEALVARVPVANVERIEFDPPCRIMRDRKLPKRPNYGPASRSH